MSLACKANETLLFIGDSITDAGRTNHLPPYGGGYVSMFRNIVLACKPELNLHIINSGVCGNTLEGLVLRWDKDVLKHKPDHLVIMIGINDAAMQHDSHRKDSEVLQEFAERFLTLLQISKNNGIHTITLMTPFYISNDKDSHLLKLTREYGHIVTKLGIEFDLKTIDLQSLFDEKLKISSPRYWSGDGIHPQPHGHYLIAKHLYKAIINA